jgi:RNA polymerase sigma-70 factor, ECF subfamily
VGERHESPGQGLLDHYDAALPQVYGYLLVRCGQRALAEELTSETFLAAVDAVRRPAPPTVSVPWLVGVARHKLIDHWRRKGREERGLRSVAGADDVTGDAGSADPWDAELDVMQARETLARLAPSHQAVLTLRYMDDLPVTEVAAVMARTVHATEGLLVRARAAFRRAYPGEGSEVCDA